MKRGDLVTVALQGDHGKPHPALVIQSGQFPETATVTVLLVTSKLVDAPLLRLTVESSQENRLDKPSQVMVDKAMTVRTDKLGCVLAAWIRPPCSASTGPWHFSWDWRDSTSRRWR